MHTTTQHKHLTRINIIILNRDPILKMERTDAAAGRCEYTARMLSRTVDLPHLQPSKGRRPEQGTTPAEQRFVWPFRVHGGGDAKLG